MKVEFVTPFFAMILVLPSAAVAQEHPAENAELKLSPPVLELLREEMREISAGIQGIAPAVATANWELVRDTSARIRASYIMERKLTPAQSAELERALPDEFKRIDAEFHQRAERLGMAATSHDAELALYHYTRMLESCTSCHSRFAAPRFPGFATAGQQAHHH